MPRRVNLPGASELFRHTEPQQTPSREVAPPPATQRPDRTEPPEQGATGRVRHDEKITVYVSTSELMALEQARLQLRGEHGLAVDRGRIVRAAVAQALSDLAENGAESDLVTRLREQ